MPPGPPSCQMGTILTANERQSREWAIDGSVLAFIRSIRGSIFVLAKSVGPNPSGHHHCSPEKRLSAKTLPVFVPASHSSRLHGEVNSPGSALVSFPVPPASAIASLSLLTSLRKPRASQRPTISASILPASSAATASTFSFALVTLSSATRFMPRNFIR